MSPTLTQYPDFEPTSLCSFSLMLRVWRRSNKCQFYSLWFDPIGTRTHDLPHSRRTQIRIDTCTVCNVHILMVHAIFDIYLIAVCVNHWTPYTLGFLYVKVNLYVIRMLHSKYNHLEELRF